MFREGVSALIINANKEFLLVNLVAFETRFYAVPGGGVEKDETHEHTVYREIKEELGIPKESLEVVGVSDTPLRFIFKTDKLKRDGVEYDGMERHFFGFRFIGSDSEIVLQDEEIRSYKWVSYNELKNYLLFDNQYEDTAEKIREIFDLTE